MGYLDLLYLRARWYNSETGTFLSKDTWEGASLRSQTLNRYSYVGGNTIKLADPSGHCPPSVCQNPDGTPSDPYYRYGDVGYLNSLSLSGSNPWFVPQPGDGVHVPTWEETVRLTERSLLPEAWQDEIDAFHEWNDQWGPLIEWGLSIAMMTGPLPSSPNPAGFEFTTSLAHNSSRITKRQLWIAENVRIYELDAKGFPTKLVPFEKRNYLLQCGLCSATFCKWFGDNSLMFNTKYFDTTRPVAIFVDGVEVGYPHRVSVSSDGLVWDPPTNT